jgi:hypothetical protein
MACDCDSQCPGSDHCIAIYLVDVMPGDDARCIVACSGDALLPAKPQKLATDRRIDISTRNVDRVKLGTFLASYLEEDVYIPAKTASEPIDLQEKQTTLGTVIERAGLLVSPAGAPPARTQP